jgi:hypothetical protein
MPLPPQAPHLPLLLPAATPGNVAMLLSGGDDAEAWKTEFGASQVVLRRTLASPVPHFLAKIDAVIMTIPQAKGLEFNDGEAAALGDDASATYAYITDAPRVLGLCSDDMAMQILMKPACPITCTRSVHSGFLCPEPLQGGVARAAHVPC